MQPLSRRSALSALLLLSGCVGQAYPPPILVPLRRYELSADVLFPFGSAVLRPEAAGALDEALASMRQTYPYPVIRVEGHTDSIGSDAANDALSLARAESVRQFLMSRGIPPGAITVEGFGKRRPVAPNTQPNGADNPAGRSRNRRVELVVTPS